MKNLIFIFLLLCSCAIAHAQNVGIIVVPIANVYSEPNESSRTIGLLLEAALFRAEIYKVANDDDEFNYFYQVSSGT